MEKTQPRWILLHYSSGEIPLSSDLEIDGIKFAGKFILDYKVKYDDDFNPTASFKYDQKVYHMTTKQVLELELIFRKLDLEDAKSDIEYINNIKIPEILESIKLLKERLKDMV